MARVQEAGMPSPWASTGVRNSFRLMIVHRAYFYTRSSLFQPIPIPIPPLIQNRFATEHSSFCVPEATFGLGLAGGLSHTLPRLLAGNQPLAQCLALTGMGLEGPDVFFTQLATNYITHRRLDMMVERLAEVRH